MSVMNRTAELGPEALLRIKSRHLMPSLYHLYRNPPEITRGEGTRLWDHEGRSYLDFLSGISVLNVGHCHPEVVEAVREQVGELAHTTTLLLTRPMMELAERLQDYVPADLPRVFFCASGSEANEGAVLLSEWATGRREHLALELGLHGRTKLGMSLTGLGFWRADDAPVGGIQHVPAPYCYRCPLRLEPDTCDLACADEVDRTIRLRTSGRPASFIMEPVLANGGMIVPPPGYLERVREILDRHGALLIMDEIQTGFGRTGRRFGFEHSRIEPDLITVAKALGGGLPIAAFLAREETAGAFDRPSASTFGGNLVASAAALAVLSILERDHLEENAAAMGARLLDRLRTLQERFACIGDVRGLGLLLGVELVGKGDAPDPDLADRVLEGLKDRGLLAGKCGAGRNVIALHPPLVISPADVDHAVGVLEDTLAEEAIR